MNIRSGMRRLWIVASVAWVSSMAIVSPLAWPFNSMLFQLISFREFPFRWAWMSEVLFWGATTKPIDYLLLTVSVPIGALLIGRTMAWVLNGFRTRRSAVPPSSVGPSDDLKVE